MGVWLGLVNHDEMYHTGTNGRQIVVNDLQNRTESDMAHVNNLLYTTCEDVLTNIATCDCGEYYGGDKKGIICPNCETEVREPIERPLEKILWLRAPRGISALMNPIVWVMLSKRFEKSDFQVLRYIADRTYNPTSVTGYQKYVPELKAAGIERRGWNYFVENFDAIMEILFSMKSLQPTKTSSMSVFKDTLGIEGEIDDPYYMLIKEQRDCIFSQFLPAPNKALLVLEHSPMKKRFYDANIVFALDAIRLMVGIDTQPEKSLNVKENWTVKSITSMAEYYERYFNNTFKGKTGSFRKHVYGGRSNFSFRAVISSRTDAHEHNEILIPWAVAVSVLGLHIQNKLINKYNWTPNEVFSFLNRYALTYHPLLDKIFEELIAECPFNGIPCLIGRHPSLERGSAQLQYIVGVKSDVRDITMSISILSVRPFNADFDGDMMYGLLPLDIQTTEALSTLELHYSAFTLSNPYTVSPNVSLPNQMVSTASYWMFFKEPPDPIKLDRMKQLFG